MAWRAKKTEGEEAEEFLRGVGQITNFIGDLFTLGSEVATIYNDHQRQQNNDNRISSPMAVSKYEKSDGEKTEEFLRDAAKLAKGVGTLCHVGSDVAGVYNKHERRANDVFNFRGRYQLTDGEKAEEALRDTAVVVKGVENVCRFGSDVARIYSKYEREACAEPKSKGQLCYSSDEETDRETLYLRDTATVARGVDSVRHVGSDGAWTGVTKYENKPKKTQYHDAQETDGELAVDILRDIATVTRGVNSVRRVGSDGAWTGVTKYENKPKKTQYHDAQETDGELAVDILRDIATVTRGVNSVRRVGSDGAWTGVTKYENKPKKTQYHDAQRGVGTDGARTYNKCERNVNDGPNFKGRIYHPSYEKPTGAGEKTEDFPKDATSKYVGTVCCGGPRVAAIPGQEIQGGAGKKPKRRNRRRNGKKKTDAEKAEEFLRDAATIARGVGTVCRAGSDVARIYNRRERQANAGHNYSVTQYYD